MLQLLKEQRRSVVPLLLLQLPRMGPALGWHTSLFYDLLQQIQLTRRHRKYSAYCKFISEKKEL